MSEFRWNGRREPPPPCDEPLTARYKNRPEDRALVKACAAAWQHLREMSEPEPEEDRT